jgi:hypothetical protein
MYRIEASAHAEIAREFGGKNGGGERNVRVGVTRSLFNEGGDLNSWWFGAKRVRFGSTVSFWSNGKKYTYPMVKNWFPFIYYKGNNKQIKFNHEVRVQRQGKGAGIGVITKFDSRINS